MTHVAGSPGRLQILKDRHGPASEALVSRVREINARKTAIKRALAAGPLTVPEVAAAAAIDPADALWSLTAMRKYGLVVEDSVDGSYVRFALPPREGTR
jgi:hypothetical protein